MLNMFLALVISICFIYILLVSIINIFRKQGFKFPIFIEKLFQNDYQLTQKNTDSSISKNIKISKDELIKIGIYALLLRLLFLGTSYIALHIFESPTHLLSLDKFLDAITEWDCNNYYRISKYGYNYWQENGYKTTLAFFPLYPFISYILNFIIHNTKLSLLLVSIISYTIGCCYLYALVTKEFNKKIAKRTLLYVSIFPFAFFFGTMMLSRIYAHLRNKESYILKERINFQAS